jgi:predicted O-methyltransferase YrrM
VDHRAASFVRRHVPESVKPFVTSVRQLCGGARLRREPGGPLEANPSDTAPSGSAHGKSEEPRFPLGHYYSAYPDPEYVKAQRERIFAAATTASIRGVDLKEAEQTRLISELARTYDSMPWNRGGSKSDDLRYCFENDFFSYGDGVMLYCMLRYLQPQRIVEVGSGFSSACMLDTRDLFLPQTAITLVEPNPERLLSLLGDDDLSLSRLSLVTDMVQNVESRVFEDLQEDDLLFIDTSHVLKCGGDVNHILFDILPVLQKGVVVHVHDIAWPFEYPYEWVMESWGWNEAYAVRAFLQYNEAFEILLFGSFLTQMHADLIASCMPLALKQPGGSLYLRKVR